VGDGSELGGGLVGENGGEGDAEGDGGEEAESVHEGEEFMFKCKFRFKYTLAR
jgi:hypothetical protein